MLKTLYAKLSFWLALLLIIIGLLYVFISYFALRQHLQQLDQQLNKNLAQTLVADRNLVKEGRLNEAALKKTFQLYMTINPSIEIYLLDLEGNILSYSADPKKIKRKAVSLAPIKSFLVMGKPYPLLGDDPRDHMRRKAFSVTPVPSKETPEGYLYVVLRGEQYTEAESVIRESFFLRISVWAVIASLAVGLLGGLIVFRLLTRRLHRLAGRMKDFENSGFTSLTAFSGTPGTRTDEIDQLGTTFEHMADRIRQQIDALTEKDAQRRQLVVQVSHDLRTPLASIMGYLETLQMKDTSLSELERAELITVALRQGRRLSRLVGELFELAGLDAREAAPVLEPCSVAELAHDVMQKYRVEAEKRSVALDIKVPVDLSFAAADAGMLERVFDNLLDNALVHTPEGGRIDIDLAQMGDTLEINISDSGHGIAPADLPHVFEPFFQGTKSSSNPDHAGLGLAIARRIMELHQGKISVSSIDGQGTRFILSLPLAG
ncbi:MAG: sensor histidine kinase [Hyphomicrobiales bacterium]|nr:MAG: sensor histidine kinase [Hyphomicrobiales bacterium]